jgi:hypothetical protein
MPDGEWVKTLEDDVDKQAHERIVRWGANSMRSRGQSQM